MMDITPGVVDNGNGAKESFLDRRLEALLERMDRLSASVEKSGVTIYQRRLNATAMANPAPIGLFAFALATALYMTQQARITEQSTQFLAFTLGMLITGFLELLRFNALGATAFCTYGSFWITVGVYGIIRTAGIFFLQSPHGEQALTSLFGIASFAFMLVSLAFNLSLPFLFFNLAIMFFLLAGGVRNTTCARTAGWWGIWTSGLAFYNGLAILFRDVWGRDVLPQFFTKQYLAAEKILFPRVEFDHGGTATNRQRQTDVETGRKVAVGRGHSAVASRGALSPTVVTPAVDVAAAEHHRSV